MEERVGHGSSPIRLLGWSPGIFDCRSVLPGHLFWYKRATGALCNVAAVADDLDALTHNPPHSAAWSIEKATSIVRFSFWRDSTRFEGCSVLLAVGADYRQLIDTVCGGWFLSPPRRAGPLRILLIHVRWLSACWKGAPADKANHADQQFQATNSRAVRFEAAKGAWCRESCQG
jgi:hypothetical protein